MPSSRRRDPQIAWPLKALALLAVGGAVFAGVDAVGGDDEPATEPTALRRTGSLEVGPADPTWAFGEFPASHEIRYRVTVSSSVTTELLRAVSPFASRTEALGSEGTTKRLSEREFGFGVLATRSATQPTTVLEVPPFLGGQRPASAMLEAEELDLVERREVRQIAGRRCQVWRFGDGLAATTFVAPNEQDYIDVCIDAVGLVLEEWQVSGGTPVRQRVAVRVQEGGVTESDVQQLPREVTLPIDKGGGRNVASEPTAQPAGPFLEIPVPPAGFTHRGRYTVVPPNPGLTDVDKRGKVTASTTDVYESGPDAVFVERGGVLDLSDPWSPDDRLPDVDLGPAIGTGELLPGTFGGEVRALLGSGRYLRIYGSVSLDDLVAIARSLTMVENGSGIGFSD